MGSFRDLKASFICLFIFLQYISLSNGDYQIGVGRADSTGPTAEVTFMGYAKSGQKGCGLHLRQFARAFIFDDGIKRTAFVTVDACMMTHSIRREVLKNLQKKYDNTYTEENLILSGTHTHGAPGGFHQEILYDISIFGFCKETFNAYVNGVTQAIINAHENMVQGKVYFSSGELLEANINRSPASYLKNPAEERAKYEHNVDKTMAQLKFVRSSDNVMIGAVNWFAVHPVSMNNTNCLVTSDNVGYASVLLEQSVNKGSLPGQGEFVGAFASTNLGDVSPNLKGPRCIDTGERCDNTTSTCNGNAKYCIAFGPGDNMFESTEIIATRLFNKAKELIETSNSEEVTGPIKYIHRFVEMPKEVAEVTLANGTVQEVHGCSPAMGYSFAAGTTDGPGEFDFTQATTSTNPFWNLVRDFIFPPTAEDVACHHPKPILIATGRINKPYQWQPVIVATQMMMLGNVVFTAVPGELTTMSGRRLRDTVRAEIIRNGGPDNTKVVINGLSNVYTSYIATPEEYQLQRYEGASTIYGPHTLTIYQKLYTQLAGALMQGKTVTPGPTPPNFTDQLLSLIKPVLFDTAGFFSSFGDCVQQPPKSVKIGDVVSVKYISGHPRNDVMHEKSFLTVERLISDNEWEVIATDASWETKFIWKRTNALLGKSQVEIQWEIRDDAKEGTYRIRHFGNYKYVFGGIYSYEGTSNKFTVSK